MTEPIKLARAAIGEGMQRILRELVAQDPKLAKKAQLVVDCGAHLNAEALDLLVEHGADLDVKVRGYGVFHAAIQSDAHGESAVDESKRLPFLRHLLDIGADPSVRGGWPAMRALELAAAARARSVIELLLEREVEVDAFAATALGDEKRVKRALATDPTFARSKDDGGMTALQYACVSRLHDDAKTGRALRSIATQLLAAGADVNAQAKSWSHDVDPIYLAISARHFDLAKLLLEQGADASSGLATAMWNVDDEFPRYGELCLERGGDPNAARHDAKPLLNDLVRWGRFKPALWLLEKGADPNLVDERGWTAVHQAASRKNQRIFDALVARGGDPDRKARDGTTPRGILGG